MIDIWHYPKKDDAKLRREILAEYFGDETFQMLKTERGQPYAKSKTGILSFSITHTATDCFLAVSTRGLPVGVDAELKTRKVKGEPILRRYGSVKEQKKYKSLKSVKDKNTFMLKSWVLKEAVSKVFGIGIIGIQARFFRSIDVTLASKNSGTFKIESDQGIITLYYRWLKSPQYVVVVVTIKPQ
ncbi:MAG: 4'-phosphopantetheinyl transferase superfamily protein [Xanthomonadaceae bacterium]|nr:4'-phosphopantetheinyl transferase superfamily protein [Xanthomonadaceae bacterium]